MGDPHLLRDVTSALRAAGCVFAEDEARLLTVATAQDPDRLADLVRRRCSGEPLELVIGFVDFAGVRIAIGPGVFVPRLRSEHLVSYAVKATRAARIAHHRRPTVVDLGTGSGALLAAVLHRVSSEAYAIDSSPLAVACARVNLAHGAVSVLLGTGLGVLPPGLRGRIDVVLANLPYVPTESIPLLPREARIYEPASALDGGPDGLAPLAAALGQAREWLAPDGHYLAEVHESQLDGVERLARRHRFGVSSVIDDETRTAVADLTVAR